jgi:PAS domain S-box-containing protein
MEFKPVRYVRLLALLTIMAIIFSVGFLLWSLRDRELNHAHLETISLTRMLMEQTEKNLESTDMLLQSIQERLLTSFGSKLPLDSDTVRLLLSSRVAGTKHLRSIFVVDANGMLVNSSRDLTGQPISLADRDYFKVFENGRPDFVYLSKPVRSRLDNIWTLTLSRRLTDREGHLRGVVVAAIIIDDFESTLSTVQIDYPRPIGIYMMDGTLVASVPHRENQIATLAPELRRDDLPTKSQQIRVLSQTNERTGKESIAIGKLTSFPLLISVTDVEKLSLASWRDTAIPITAGAVLVCIFTALMAAYLVNKLQGKQALTIALSAADERYQHTVNSVMDAIVAVDEDMHIIMFNPSAEAMFGLEASKALGQPIEVLMPERLRSVHRRHMQGFSASEKASRAMAPQMEIFGVRSNGTEFPLESTISHSMIGGKLQMTAVLRDVTERRKTESTLRTVNTQLRELSANLQNVREEERKRFSRELHDDLGQRLTGLKLSLSWMASRLKEGKPTAVSDVDEMRHQMDAAIGSVRRIAAELRPRVMDDLDFKEALTWQTQEFFKHSGIQIELDLRAAEKVTEDGLATALFRIVQESLTNVVRHAAADKVVVSLLYADDQLTLAIRDNGRGFDWEGTAGGVGLVSMRERCGAIGAVFKVNSYPGAGTLIEITVPMTEKIPTESVT